jgi:hypothetical protein
MPRKSLIIKGYAQFAARQDAVLTPFVRSFASLRVVALLLIIQLIIQQLIPIVRIAAALT